MAFSIAARFNSFWHPVYNLFGFSFPNEKLVAQGRTGRRVTIIFTWKKFSSYKRGLFYHLHPQTGRFTIWVNGKQNSALVNFATESRLPFLQISSIYCKTTAKAFQKLVSKMALEQWTTNLRVEHSDRENSTPFQTFRCSRKFSTKVVFLIISNQRFSQFFRNSKQLGTYQVKRKTNTFLNSIFWRRRVHHHI